MFARVLMYFSIPVALVLAWYLWDQSRIEVEIAAVEQGEAVDAAPAQVTVEPALEITVNSEVPGRVTGGGVKVGQAVKKNDVLFVLSPAGGGSPVEVTAAFDGVITQVNSKIGEAVAAIEPMARLWNGKVEVAARVAPENFGGVELGLDAEVFLPTATEGWVPARVMHVPGFAEDYGGDFKLLLAVELPPERIAPGLLGDARIIRRRIPGALLIPEEALRDDGTVLVVDGKRARRVAVKTGQSFHGKVPVFSGLTVDNAVIVRSASPLGDGSRIRVRGY